METRPLYAEKVDVRAVSYNIRLLVSCPDKKGLIAAISSFVAMHGGNILSADQHVGEEEGRGTFFMRLEIESEGIGLKRDEFGTAFAPLARRHKMVWSVSYTDAPKRMAILVSKYEYCLMDLLWRWDAGELDARIPLIVFNHPDLRSRAELYGIPFYHLSVDKQTKVQQESGILDLLSGHELDLVVLARYMQILTLGPTSVG